MELLICINEIIKSRNDVACQSNHLDQFVDSTHLLMSLFALKIFYSAIAEVEEKYGDWTLK